MVLKWLGFQSRVIQVKFEADLFTDDGEEVGELEWKRYEDGGRKMRLYVRGLPVPDGTEVEAVVGGDVIGRIVVNEGRGKLKLEDEGGGGGGDTVPPVANGDAVEVRSAAGTLLRGTLRPD